MRANRYSKVLGLWHFGKKVIKRLGALTMPALKYCVLRGSFSEMFDSLAIITSSGVLRTRARTDGRNKGLWALVLSVRMRINDNKLKTIIIIINNNNKHNVRLGGWSGVFQNISFLLGFFWQSLASLGSTLVSFWLLLTPLGALGLPLGVLWAPLDLFGLPLGPRWLSLGSPWATFAILLKIGRPLPWNVTNSRNCHQKSASVYLPGGPGGPAEVVSWSAARTLPSTRAGGQDDVSYTNSLKL